MPELQTLDCFQPGLAKLERVAYFNRMLLTAEDMRTDQDFVLQKLRRHNRFLHGWGVVCGLLVKAAPTATQPWRVQIGEGYALGPFGDEIFVGRAVFMDLKNCGPGAMTNPCEPSLLRDPAPATGSEIFLAIKYAECKARPVQSMPEGCGCEDEACEYSRIRDSFSLECLAELPPSHVPPADLPSLCDVISGKAYLACPACPTDPWVVLARVALPASPAANLTDAAIDNKPPVRRVVFSTAMLQEQIIDCCCGGDHDRPPVRVEADISVDKRADTGEGREPGTRLVHYDIFVTNLSTTTASEHVLIQDTLSSREFNLQQLVDNGALRVGNFQADPPAAWIDKVPLELIAEIPRLEPGTSVRLSFEVTVVVEALRGEGNIENLVRVKADTPDPNQANNVARTTTRVR